MSCEIPTILDVEASGFGRGSYPIEIGFATPDFETRNFLVRPVPEWQHWSEQAEAVHGIDRWVLHRHGRPVEEVADALNEALGGRTVYCDAWGFDVAWIARLYAAAERLQRFRIETIFMLLDEAQYEAWNDTCDAVSAELDLARHRASSDARIQQLAYLRLKGMAV